MQGGTGKIERGQAPCAEPRLTALGLGGGWLGFLGVLGAIPAIDAAVALVNRGVALSFEPVLPHRLGDRLCITEVVLSLNSPQSAVRIRTAPSSATRVCALEPLLLSDTRGKPRVDDRRVINGIVHVLRSGGRWVDAPDVYALKKRHVCQCRN